jgi:membrane protein DedA with SNARE-associated domain
MDINHISQLLLEYRYFIVIPLAFLEGPLVAFVAATLASLGYFNMGVLAILFFINDVGLDSAYYAGGHYWGKAPWVQRMLKKFNVTPEHLEEVRVLWEKHPARTMFFGKLSYGLASTFMVVAGAVNMRFSTFIKWGAVMAVGQYGIFLGLGYFLGKTFGGTISNVITMLEYTILGVSILAIVWYVAMRYIRSKSKLMSKDDGKEVG